MICRICDNLGCTCLNDDIDSFGDNIIIPCGTCGAEYMFCPCDTKTFRSENISVDRSIHVMNKNESKLCRKLMSQTGLTEKEVREHKKYRILLSEAQKAGSKELGYYDKKKRTRKRYMKAATKQTGLAKEHPTTQEKFKELMRADGRWLHYYNN